MKKQTLLIIAAGLLMASCGGTASSSTSESSSTQTSTETSKTTSSSSIDARNALERFLDLLEEKRNFTMYDEGYRTLYGYGDEAIYDDYLEDGGSYGLILNENQGFLEYDLVGGEVAPIQYYAQGSSAYDFIYTPMDLAFVGAGEWTEDSDGLFITENEEIKGIVADLGSYGYQYGVACGEVQAYISDDGSDALLSTSIETYMGSYDITVEVVVGETSSSAVDAYLANPIDIPEPTDWPESFKAVSEQWYGFIAPWYEGFDHFLSYVDLSDTYGMLAVYDRGLGRDGFTGYVNAAISEGYTKDAEESEDYDVLLTKDDGQGSIAKLEVVFTDASELDEEELIEYPNGMFVLEIWVEEYSEEGTDYETANMKIAKAGFPTVSACEGLSDFRWADSTSQWEGYCDFWMVVTWNGESQSAIDAAASSYASSLTEIGLSFAETGMWGDVYKDEDELIEVDIFHEYDDEEGAYILEIGYYVWPAE